MAKSAQAASKVVDAVSIAQITFDEEGKQLTYPAAVFVDQDQEELYVVNGGDGRIIVYGPDYFPRWAIGSGRGVLAPRDGAVLPDGRVFAVQVKNRTNPRARITILNGAFFPVQDIPLENVAGAEDFIPRNVAFGRNGLIYVAGDLYRGVLVLDDEGFFLRKLQPTDKISALSLDYQRQAEASAEETAEASSQGETAAEEDAYANIPEEFRPSSARGGRVGAGSETKGAGPVKVNYVATDSKGRIYCLSAETGKIYVYDEQEQFLFAFGTKGGSPGQMSYPRGMAIDEENGLIYVADYMRHTVLAYNLAGDYMFETGGRGTTPGWFNFPNDIAVNSRGEIIVADLFNKRVQVLDVEYESRFLNLEELLNPDSGTGETEQQKPPTEGDADPGLEIEGMELVPDRRDSDREDSEAEKVSPPEDKEIPQPTDSGEEKQVTIEILQKPDIPAAGN